MFNALFRLCVAGESLPGMNLGVSTMRKGEKARFLIDPKYYFKELGCPPRVPPNATGKVSSVLDVDHNHLMWHSCDIS